MNLTSLEVKMLRTALNYNDRDQQHSDNYSNLDLAAAEKICGGKHEAAGVIGSLVKKGLTTDVEYLTDVARSNGIPESEADDIIWLTHAGVDAVFDYMESEG